jgi:predicted SAM-dependent methyltransferase
MKVDIGCGQQKPGGWTGMDRRDVDGVDVVHDWLDIPWPFDDGEVDTLRASHVLEHVCPLRIIEWMNEAWRVLKPQGRLYISLPHAGTDGFYQDPTHCLQANAATWRYFDPDHALYRVYQPKPWRIHSLKHSGDNMDVVLEKREV